MRDTPTADDAGAMSARLGMRALIHTPASRRRKASSATISLLMIDCYEYCPPLARQALAAVVVDAFIAFSIDFV